MRESARPPVRGRTDDPIDDGGKHSTHPLGRSRSRPRTGSVGRRWTGYWVAGRTTTKRMLATLRLLTETLVVRGSTDARRSSRPG